ncbi:MAG: arylsulfatase [Planctomycetes bacterium]|nr:arylsulfatase [Planctomycetota bacterium]
MLSCSPWVCPAFAADLTDRPNVVLILADDQGYGDFSCHGNPALKTPHLDRLHHESIRLTDFHVAPMCTPTRGQLMTGLDALRNGATSVCAGRSFIRRAWPGADADPAVAAPSPPATMAEWFAGAGYQTALFGKWHLGDSYPNLPHHRGFKETVFHLGWGITSIADPWCNDYFNGHFSHHGKLQSYEGYCTDVWFRLAREWIKERHARNEPFFLYLPTNAPHGPLWVPDKYREPYLAQGLKRPLASFFGMIANIDENVGQLDQLLAELKLRDNTILVYFHDNGGTAGVNFYNAGMRAGKRTYYEGGHRAACFIRWPGGTWRQACDVDSLTQVQDLLPTLIETCNLGVPKGSFDGRSLTPLLAKSGANDRADSSTSRAREVFGERKLVVQYGENPEKWESAVLWKRWRLVHGEELYDLATDPAQAKNVAEQHPDVLAALRAHYQKWWGEVGPLLDHYVPVVLGSEHENPVTLSSADWAKVYCDNMPDLRAGKQVNGPWNVEFVRGGTYEVALRRWPRESGAAITAPVPEFVAVDGKLPAGVAVPAAKVRLQVDDFDRTEAISADTQEVVFTVEVKTPHTTKLQSWLYDASGKELSGAYYAYVRRK